MCIRDSLLLHRIARNETRREHPPRLANPVRPVDRLRLHRRVPPRIEEEHVVRRREVQAQPTRLEADEEHPARRVGLKARDTLLPVAVSYTHLTLPTSDLV